MSEARLLPKELRIPAPPDRASKVSEMVKSKAATVEEYLAELGEDRRAALAAVRAVILDHLPEGYEETMQYGMIGYAIPLEKYPTTYNGQALSYASIASQKNYMTIYLMGIYGDPELKRWFVEQYQASGKKLDMGKSCVRFKKLDDLPMELIGRAIAATSMAEFIRRYEASRHRK